jgi:outer membrane murein-binding lipoprotein Lpp
VPPSTGDGLSSRRGPPTLPSLLEHAPFGEESYVDIADRRQSRTVSVKVRLGPMIQRMKVSLAKIQDLEESLNRSSYLEKDHLEHSSSPPSSSPLSSSAATKSGLVSSATVAVRSTSSSRTHRKSHRLLKNSMRMLKEKLHSLHEMEDDLRESEDRHQQLIQHVVHASQSSPSNLRLMERVEELEEEKHQLERACRRLVPLEYKLKELRIQLKDMQVVKKELQDTKKQFSLLQKDLAQRQNKINQQAMKCDDLECQIDQLQSMCDVLRNDLKLKKEQNEQLEQEVTEERKRHQRLEQELQIREQELQIQRTMNVRHIETNVLMKNQADSGDSTEPESDSSFDDASSRERTNESLDEEEQQEQQQGQQTGDHCGGGPTDKPAGPLSRLQQVVFTTITSTTTKSPPGGLVETVDTSQCSSASATSDGSSTCSPSFDRPGHPIPKDVETFTMTVLDGSNNEVLPDSDILLERLVRKLDAMDHENSYLMGCQEAMSAQFHALLQRNSLQSARIVELERLLQAQQRQPAPPRQEQGNVLSLSKDTQVPRLQFQATKQHQAQVELVESSLLPGQSQEVEKQIEPGQELQEPKNREIGAPSFFRKLLQSDTRQLLALHSDAKQLKQFFAGSGSAVCSNNAPTKNNREHASNDSITKSNSSVGQDLIQGAVM